MRKLLVFGLAMSVLIQLSAQSSFRKNTYYGQFAGNGLFLSANYERQLGKKPGLGLHIGIGLGDDRPSIPIGMTYMLDLGNRKSFLEAGAGITLAEEQIWVVHGSSESRSYRFGYIPSIGYRHHTTYGLMWKINYTPIFTRYRNIPWFPGFSIGWRI